MAEEALGSSFSFFFLFFASDLPEILISQRVEERGHENADGSGCHVTRTDLTNKAQEHFPPAASVLSPCHPHGDTSSPLPGSSWVADGQIKAQCLGKPLRAAGGIAGALGVRYRLETKPGVLRGSIASHPLERGWLERRQDPGQDAEVPAPRKTSPAALPWGMEPRDPLSAPTQPLRDGSHWELCSCSSSGAGAGGAAAARGFSAPCFKLLLNPAPSRAVGRRNGAAGHPEWQRWLLQHPSTRGLTPGRATGVESRSTHWLSGS